MLQRSNVFFDIYTGMKNKGIFLQPQDNSNIDCYVDNDFGGAYNVYPDQHHMITKSRILYVSMFQGCSVVWVPKMQTQICLSKMESEYLALSKYIRDLIPLHEIQKDLNNDILKENDYSVRCSTNSKLFDDGVIQDHTFPLPKSKVYEDNAACLKFARLPRLTHYTQHIDVPYHRFRSKVEQLEISVEPISTD